MHLHCSVLIGRVHVRDSILHITKYQLKVDPVETHADHRLQCNYIGGTKLCSRKQRNLAKKVTRMENIDIALV